MNVYAIEFEVVRHRRKRVLRGGTVAELDDIAVPVLVRLELEKLQPPVVHAGRGPQGAPAVW